MLLFMLVSVLLEESILRKGAFMVSFIRALHLKSMLSFTCLTLSQAIGDVKVVKKGWSLNVTGLNSYFTLLFSFESLLPLF